MDKQKDKTNKIYKQEDEEASIDILEGRNTVMEAIRSGRDINKILVQSGEREGSILKLISMAKDKRIVVQYVAKQKLDSISSTSSHQGVVAYIAAHQYASLEDVFDKAKQKGEHPFLVLLDEITDPHNLGSIMRTADAAGAHGIIIPKRRSVGLTSTVAKVSAGAIEYVPVVQVTNLVQTIEKLKEKGVWVAGIDVQGDTRFYKSNLKGPIAIVIGSEGQGIGRLIKEKCDFLINIPMKGHIDSLNASVASSIIMYEILRQRDE